MLRPDHAAGVGDAFWFMFEDPEPQDFDVRDGIAWIKVHRSFLRPRTYGRIRKQVDQAVAAQNVRGILLDIDSPGGEVAGLFDLADYIFEARAAKPIWAIANDDAFSAAYAIASGADRIAVTRTGGIGGIGVIAVHVEYSKMDERVGVKWTPVYSGERKADYIDSEPLNDTARTLLQTEVDRLRELFVETVSRNRGVSPEAIRDTEAGAFFGPGGVPLLADAVENIDAVFEGFRTAIETDGASAHRSSTKEQEMAEQKPKGTKTETPAAGADAAGAASAEAAAEAPEKGADVVDISAAREAGAKEGAEAAQKKSAERTSAIRQACDLAGCPERFGEFLDTKLSAEGVGKQILEERAASGGTEIAGQHGADAGGDSEPVISTSAVYENRRVS